MKRTTLLVTIAVGKPYVENWRTHCAPNWQRYADAHGFDVMCIDRPLDESRRARRRSVAWQKCLILGQPFSQKYTQVVWVDADILINPRSAPSVVADVPLEQVGAVRAYSTPTRELFLQAFHRITEFYEAHGENAVHDATPHEYHANFGLPSAEYDDVVQTGVLVLSPSHHRELLEKVYFEYEDKGASQWHYEMRPLSHELQKAGVVRWIDHRFNQGWVPYQVMQYPFLLNRSPQTGIVRRVRNRLLRQCGIRSMDEELKRACATTAFVNSFFLHFAASMGDMHLVDQHIASWRDILHPAGFRA